jgi:hypothetical protein
MVAGEAFSKTFLYSLSTSGDVIVRRYHWLNWSSIVLSLRLVRLVDLTNDHRC